MEDVNSILYVGASVTAQKDGYRSQVTGLLGDISKNNIVESLVATGATGSMFGLCNISTMDLGTYDICFFEYSTGDLNLGLTPEDLLEEIIWNFLLFLSSKSKNLFVIHNHRSDFEGNKGNMIRDVYDNVASELGVPVFNCYHAIEELKKSIPADRWSSYYRDKVHTSEKGAKFIAQDILARLEKEKLTDNSKITCQSLQTALLPLYNSLPVDGVYTYPVSEQEFPFVRIANAKKKFRLALKGELWGAVFIVGPKSGWIKVTTDNETLIEFSLFDAHCHYARVQPRTFRKTFHEYTNITFEIMGKNIEASSMKVDNADYYIYPRCGDLSMLMGRNLSIQNPELIDCQ